MEAQFTVPRMKKYYKLIKGENMKKVIIIILAIVLVVGFFFGIKSLLDREEPEEIQNVTENSGMEWEIEAEYTYDGDETE